jgi:hypothetical protein
MAVVCGAQVAAYHRNARVVTRDFYGALRVTESFGVRRLYHGTIEHGAQFMDTTKAKLATTYYTAESGIGLALRFCCEGPKRVGVVGLGVGTLAAYGRAGDYFRFYEIDPEVIRLARSEFSFLGSTPATVDVVPGDARVSLSREGSQQFDVLAIDAFSGDAIPIHLLTKEAFGIYRRHLKASGILALHVSNQFLDLAPVVARLAPGAVSIQNDQDDSREIAAATWILVTSDSDFMSRPEIVSAARPVPPRRGPMWTDDYSNLFQVLKW